jgi:hypothetical protein
LQQDWLEITGDSFICDIRKIHNVERALKYILKYLFKSEQTKDSKETYNKVMKNRRLLSAFGNFWGMIPRRDTFLECPECGGTIWLSEFELSHLSESGIPVDSRSPPDNQPLTKKDVDILSLFAS